MLRLAHGGRLGARPDGRLVPEQRFGTEQTGEQRIAARYLPVQTEKIAAASKTSGAKSDR
jgi:hypothetical protein